MVKQLIVTHHAPDLDAVGAVWMLKRFDTQHFADAQVTFVDPGSQIDPGEAERLGFQMHQVTHVDTGLGEFDHHQTERGHQPVCATSLVYDHICQLHPEQKEDKALHYLVQFATEVDHFGEIYWPDAESPRYNFMVHELLKGLESSDPHNDDSLLHFGLQCLDAAYACLRDYYQAKESLQDGQIFETKAGKALAIESRNDFIIQFAQKNGFVIVIRKDPKNGEIRIKARPDTEIDLKAVYERVLKVDQVGSWYYHPSGKMLLNGSRKKRHQKPSPLTLEEIIQITKEAYA